MKEKEKMAVKLSQLFYESEHARQVADSQRVIAQAAEEKAKRLSLLSTAQNLALKSLSMDGNSKVIGLLAVQAYNFNLSNGGSIDDPVIYKALEKAYTTLDHSIHSVYKGSPNEIWSIANNKDDIFSADMDGNIFKWNNSGNNSILSISPLQSYINFISLNHDGEKVVTNYENNTLILRNLSQNKYESSLKGHINPVKTAAWSNDGNLLATGGQDSLIIIWNTGIQPAVPIKTFKTASTIRCLLFCSNDSIFSVYDDGSIYLLNVKNSTSELLLASEFSKPICIAWNRPKAMLLAGSSDGNLILIDLSRYAIHGLMFILRVSAI
jgi:WD40 repeat protein